MNRRKFFERTLGVLLLAGALSSFVGCNGDEGLSGLDPSGEQNGEPDCSANGTAVQITGNHGHTLEVSKRDIQAAAEKTYTIQGTAGHAHNVTLSASDFTSLQNDTAIELNSTTGDGHSHSIIVSCAALVGN